MDQLLRSYKEKAPEIIFEWNDRLTSARGWVVINSLRNGAAGGGTRMRKGLTKEEVISLAKVMEIKFGYLDLILEGLSRGSTLIPGIHAGMKS
jgi:glutamate dehydrogenase/leucine dehydrogenase